MSGEPAVVAQSFTSEFCFDNSGTDGTFPNVPETLLQSSEPDEPRRANIRKRPVCPRIAHEFVQVHRLGSINLPITFSGNPKLFLTILDLSVSYIQNE